MLERQWSTAMNTHSDYHAALEADDDTDLSPVTPPPGSWLPPAQRCGPTLDPRLWQRRAARGISWHRTGKAFRGDYADYRR
jgi:hypothetical protein